MERIKNENFQSVIISFLVLKLFTVNWSDILIPNKAMYLKKRYSKIFCRFLNCVELMIVSIFYGILNIQLNLHFKKMKVNKMLQIDSVGRKLFSNDISFTEIILKFFITLAIWSRIVEINHSELANIIFFIDCVITVNKMRMRWLVTVSTYI